MTPGDLAPGEIPVCNRCGFRASWNGRKWVHASAADGAFCALLYGASS